MAFRRPVPLTQAHNLDTFSCGRPELDRWLREKALHNQQQGYTRTFVIADDDNKVAGYHSICGGIIHRNDLSRSVKGGQAPEDIPVALLARLAVSEKHQGQGLGAALLKNALASVLSASQWVAFRGVVVHALDDDAVAFYSRYGFQPTKGMARRMILPCSVIAASLEVALGNESSL